MRAMKRERVGENEQLPAVDEKEEECGLSASASASERAGRA